MATVDLDQYTGGMTAAEIGGVLEIGNVRHLPGVLIVAESDVADATEYQFLGAGGRQVYPVPFGNIEDAVSAAESGDTIIVMPGGYSPSFACKSGVTIYCLPGVYLYDPVITATSITGMRFLGDAILQKTDSSSTMLAIDQCTDYLVEIHAIEIIKASGDTARSGIYATSSSGEIVIKSKSYTYDRQIIAIDNEWGSARKTILRTRENQSLRASANSNNNDVQLVGILNGAEVDWHVSGLQESQANNIALVGMVSSPPSSIETVLRIISDGAVFSPSTGSFLLRGDTTNGYAVNTVEIQGSTRHRGSEFARNGGTTSTGSTLNIFGTCHSVNSNSTFATVGVGAVTVSASA